jgi:hypothetical protein
MMQRRRTMRPPPALAIIFEGDPCLLRSLDDCVSASQSIAGHVALTGSFDLPPAMIRVLQLPKGSCPWASGRVFCETRLGSLQVSAAPAQSPKSCAIAGPRQQALPANQTQMRSEPSMGGRVGRPWEAMRWMVICARPLRPDDFAAAGLPSFSPHSVRRSRHAPGRPGMGPRALRAPLGMPNSPAADWASALAQDGWQKAVAASSEIWDRRALFRGRREVDDVLETIRSANLRPA